MRIFDFKTPGVKIAALSATLFVLVGLGLTVWGMSSTEQPVRSVAAIPTTAPATVAATTALASTDTRIVMVSGRDDHGLLETPHVPLYRAPGETVETALLHDGAFAKVLEVRGNWLHIQAIASPYEIGWLDDYYLRGRALRVDGGGQVEFAAARYTNEQVFVAVYPIGLKSTSVTWLPETQLREVGAQQGNSHSH